MPLANKHNLPLSIAAWLAHDEYQRSSDPKVISATSLLKSVKSLLLSKQVDSSNGDIYDFVASSMGTAIHAGIERAWLAPNLKENLREIGYPTKLVDAILVNPESHELYPGCVPIYLEQRRNKEIQGWVITGQFDFVANGKLEDVKSTGTYNWISQSNREKYIQQASIYRWLFPDLVKEDVFSINYIFTDWSSVKARQDSSYPQKRIIQQDYPLMPVEATEAFIRQRLQSLSRYMDSPQEELPDCTAEELWLKPSVFKYYKNPANKTRSTKNFDSYWEANKLYVEDGSVGEVVEVKGEAAFCRYCAAASICNQAKQLMQEGRLLL